MRFRKSSDAFERPIWPYRAINAASHGGRRLTGWVPGCSCGSADVQEVEGLLRGPRLPRSGGSASSCGAAGSQSEGGACTVTGGDIAMAESGTGRTPTDGGAGRGAAPPHPPSGGGASSAPALPAAAHGAANGGDDDGVSVVTVGMTGRSSTTPAGATEPATRGSTTPAAAARQPASSASF